MYKWLQCENCMTALTFACGPPKKGRWVDLWGEKRYICIQISQVLLRNEKKGGGGGGVTGFKKPPFYYETVHMRAAVLDQVTDVKHGARTSANDSVGRAKTADTVQERGFRPGLLPCPRDHMSSSSSSSWEEPACWEALADAAASCACWAACCICSHSCCASSACCCRACSTSTSSMVC